MGLPFESTTHNFVATEGRKVQMQAESPCIVFKKEVRETEQQLVNDLVVVHRFFESGTSSDSASELKEFLTDVVYTC